MTANIAPEESIGPSDRRGRVWGQYVLVAVLAGVVVFWRLGAATMTDHECHLALTARTMADPTRQEWLVPGNKLYEVVEHSTVNHWLVPVENGRPRLVKTPLPYWCAAIAGRLCGGVTDFSARASSAACSVLLGVVTLWLGRRLMGGRAALYGTLMLVACVGFQKCGRNARPEIILCLLMTMSMACFHRAVESPAGARRAGFRVGWMAAFWLCMGLGNLAKEFVPMLLLWPLAAYVFWRRSHADRGDAAALRWLGWFLAVTVAGVGVHIAISFVPALQWWRAVGAVSPGKGAYLTMAAALGGPMLWYFFRTRAWGPVGRLLPTAIPGVVVMAAMFVPWMWYMHRLFPDMAGGVFADQVTDRAAGTGEWTPASPVRYAQALLTLSLPWVAFLPAAFAMPLMRRFAERRGGLVYLLLWCVGLLVVFSAAAAKREHYILPMLPALCLLMGFAAEDVFHRHAWISKKFGRMLAMGYGLAGVLSVAGVGGIWAVVQWEGAATGAMGRLRAYFLDTAPGTVGWPLLFAVVAIAAVPVIAAGAAALRGRLGAALPLLAVGFAAVYVGHWTVLPAWDPRAPVREFARDVAKTVPASAAVHHWGDPQAKTVFYLGRQLPGLHWPFYAADREATGQEVHDRVVAWLGENRRAAPWVVAYLEVRGSVAPEATVLRELGYEPVLTRQGVQKKEHLFGLWHRRPDAAPREGRP